MCLFMGLSEWLRHLKPLPIVLGVFLVGMGLQTVRSDDESDEAGGSHASTITDTCLWRTASACLGDRFRAEYEEHDLRIFAWESKGLQVTLLGVQILCLMAVDLALE